MSARTTSMLLAASVAAYVLLPGHPLGVLPGVPLDWLSLGALALLGCLLFGFGQPAAGHPTSHRRSRLLTLALVGTVVLIAVKLLLWVSAPAYGLAASYHPRPRIGETPERSTQFQLAAATRVEASPGQPGFQLHFFNDIDRFNYYEDKDPDRKALPFAVRYDGFLQVAQDGTFPISLTARGLAVLSIDGAPTLTVGSQDAEVTDRADLTLTAGAHPIRLDFVHRGGESPALALAADFGSGLQPLGPPQLTLSAESPDLLARDRLAAILARSLDRALLAGLLGAVGLALAGRVRLVRAAPGRRLALLERPLLAGLLLGVAAYALVTTADLDGRTTVLEGGQDWLTYESYARDILLNGPLMTLGEPLGKGKPFFFQPFYPYALAGMHWLTGEGLWGPIVLQIIGIGVAGVLVYFLAKRLFGTVSAVAALALFLALGWTQLDWIARKLLSENLYFVVLPAALLYLARAIDERRLSDVAWAGFWFGVAAITRAPTLIFVPGAALILVASWRRAGQSWQRAALAFVMLGLCTALVSALVPARNYIVSGRPALVASNGGATLLLAHEPTEKVRLSGIDRDPLYDALRLDRATREVAEFVRQDPIGYFWTLVPLGLYSIGVSGAVEGHDPVALDVLFVTLLYVVAVIWLPAARTLRFWPVHLFIVIHFVIMVTFLPYVYGYRQVLPMQVLMLVVDGVLIAHIAGRLAERWRGATKHQPLMEQRPA